MSTSTQPAEPVKAGGVTPVAPDVTPNQPARVETSKAGTTDSNPASDSGKRPQTADSIVNQYKAARRALVDAVTEARLQMLRCLAKLKEVDAKDDYVQSLLGVVRAHGPDGVTVAQIHPAFNDGPELTKARKALEDSGDVVSRREGQTFRLIATNA